MKKNRKPNGHGSKNTHLFEASTLVNRRYSPIGVFVLVLLCASRYFLSFNSIQFIALTVCCRNSFIPIFFYHHMISKKDRHTEIGKYVAFFTLCDRGFNVIRNMGSKFRIDKIHMPLGRRRRRR